MTATTGVADRTADAAGAAARAIGRAGVIVRELSTAADTVLAAGLLREVWRGPEVPVPANLLRTVQHAGGYVYGAYEPGGALLAASMGLLATVAGEPGLHSHITGVAPSAQRRGLGYALKQHQRDWCLQRSIGAITWTCDPLVRRNVGFNLHALGATVTAYLPDHYGPMLDGINAGDESDRFELRWDLRSDRAVLAGRGRLPLLDDDAPGALLAGPDGRPRRQPVAGPRWSVQLPGDIEAVRRTDPAGALEWRHAVRCALQAPLTRGAAVLGLTAAGALVLQDRA